MNLSWLSFRAGFFILSELLQEPGVGYLPHVLVVEQQVEILEELFILRGGGWSISCEGETGCTACESGSSPEQGEESVCQQAAYAGSRLSEL